MKSASTGKALPVVGVNYADWLPVRAMTAGATLSPNLGVPWPLLA
jgi:hypothetical protein